MTGGKAERVISKGICGMCMILRDFAWRHGKRVIRSGQSISNGC